MVVPRVEPAPLTEEAEGVNSVDVWERKKSGTREEEAVHASKRLEVGPPPFLKKTFALVEDPNSNPIVSWGETRDSFVVWDSHQFSKTLLPKFFKHSNFSTFIRQLNTYGFRKVDSKRWEFANEGFQGGKKHLLKSIKRRSKCNKLLQAGAAFDYFMDPGLEGEVEQLKKEQSMLGVEILKLMQQQEGLQAQLTNVEERARCADLKQFQMLVFLTGMVKKPAFVEQLIHRVKGKGELDGADMVKRRRLLGTQCPVTVSFPKGMDTAPLDVDCRHQGYEQLATLQSKQSRLVELLSETVNTSSIDPTIGSRARAHDVSCAYDVMSEKLMGESSVVGEGVDVSASNIYLELEDLISKQVAGGLVGQTN